jgi:hypothetical protein
MTPLALRKQAVLLEAALHRAALAEARSGIAARMQSARRQIHASRWWLAGAALAVGLVLRRSAGVVRWLPLATTALRATRTLAARDPRTG